MKANRKNLRVQDLASLKVIAQADIAPESGQIIFSLQTVNAKNKKKYSNLWIVSCHRPARQFTYGEHNDIMPRWSCDGKAIAFLSNRKDEKQFQLYTIAVDGGEAKPLTAMKGEFKSFSWSPDSQSLICCFRKKDPEAIAREKDEEKKKLGVVSRHINRVFYKYDGQGYLPKERWHLWQISVGSGKNRQLTSHPVYDEFSPACSPDGKRIVFISNRSKEPDLDPEAVDIFTMPVSGGAMRKLKTPSGPKDLPVFSPDGKYIAYVGCQVKNQWWRNTRLWLMPVQGAAAATNLTRQFDFTISSGTINDVVGVPELSAPIWTARGRQIIFQVSHHGNTVVKALNLADKKITEVISGPGVVASLSMDKAGRQLAYFFSDSENPGEVWVHDMTSGIKRRLTSVNSALLSRVRLGPVEEVWMKRKAAKTLQGWIIFLLRIKTPRF